MPTDRPLLDTARFRIVERTTDDGRVAGQYVLHPGAVVVLPRLADGRVCLIRNVRPAVGKTLIELPAGTREPGEDPAETARRELEEETGYRAATITPLPAFYLSPGILNEKMHAYLATDLTEGDPRREPGEQIENLVVPWPEAMELVRTGEIEDAKTVAALLYCECFGE